MIAIKDLTFPSSTGNNIIYARIAEPECEPRGIVQIAHGIAEHIGRYERFMQILAQNGFIAVGNDHLGHGLSVLSDRYLGFFRQPGGNDAVIADMRRLHVIMKKKYPELPYYLLGHSMGSFFAC